MILIFYIFIARNIQKYDELFGRNLLKKIEEKYEKINVNNVTHTLCIVCKIYLNFKLTAE